MDLKFVIFEDIFEVMILIYRYQISFYQKRTFSFSQVYKISNLFSNNLFSNNLKFNKKCI